MGRAKSGTNCVNRRVFGHQAIFPRQSFCTVGTLVLIHDGQVHGDRLGSRPLTGDLGDCYEFHFDPDGSGKPQFRLVSRRAHSGRGGNSRRGSTSNQGRSTSWI